MSGFSIRIDGLKRFGRKLDALQRMTGDLRPMLTRIGADLQRDVLHTFRTQTDPKTGRAWRKTSKLTLSTRPKGGGKSLQATGRLLQSIVSQAIIPVGPPNSPRISISTRGVKYAAVHQGSFPGLGLGTKKIRAKPGKALAIPLTREAARAPSARIWWQRHSAEGPFILKQKLAGPQGRAFIATHSEGGGLKLHFLLKKSVIIPQRRFLGVGKRQIKIIDRRVTRELRAAFNQGGA